MAFTQANLDALNAALAQGTKRVKMDGEEVEYASLSEMRSLASQMKAELAGTAGAMVVTVPKTNRGL